MHVSRLKLFAILAVLAAALAASTGAGAAPSAAFRDSQIAALAPPGYVGGTYQTAQGETIQVFSHPAYAADTTYNQRWVEFISAMPHGAEVAEVAFYFAPLSEVQRACGPRTLACYSPREQVIMNAGDDIPNRATAKSILLHEYGHHLALHRDNAPWLAIDYGTKRWASFMNVCRREQEGTLFPGDEGSHYRDNPGEIFAETYRVWAERKLGLPEAPWNAVGAGHYPTEAAIAMVEQDVLNPWVAPTVRAFTSSFKQYAGSTRKFAVLTSLDGELLLTLRTPAGTRFELRLYDQSGRRLLAVAGAASARVKQIQFSICGQRQLLAQVVRVAGYGSFSLTVSKP